MKVSISIMMHPKRAEFIPYLFNRLGRVPIAMDQISNVWDTCRRAWQLSDKDATHHCVIQDDAIIGKDFYKNLYLNIERHPNKAISLYAGRRKNNGKLFIEKNGGVKIDWLYWGLAVCLPIKRIDEMISFGDNLKELDDHDDTKIAKYLKSKKMKVWYPMPSLVDHRVEEGLAGKNKGTKIAHRKAIKFIGE